VVAASAVRSRTIDWRVILVWAAAVLVVYARDTFVSPFLCEGMAQVPRTERSGGFWMLMACSSSCRPRED
jgi:hypothetical protein